MRTPTARDTALAIAEATGKRPPSPMPLEPNGPGPLPFSIKIVSSVSGTSSNRRHGVVDEIAVQQLTVFVNHLFH